MAGGSNLHLVLILSVLTLGASHSWLDCLDWVGTADSGTCRGYARNWFKQPASPMGTDVGRDRRPRAPVPQGLKCNNAETPAGPGGYSASAPMAKVYPGQTIRLRWPAKNHAATAQAGTVELFIGAGPGKGDDWSHITSLGAWVKKYPKLQQTFSNCIPNRSGVDKAPCIGDFTLPTDLQKGIYSVMWWWEFNPGEFYNSCADMEVTDKPAPTPAPTPPPAPKPNPCTMYSTPPEKKAMSICPGENGDDCSRHHDCCGGGTKCYYKSAGYAGCLKTCPGPGYINPDEPKHLQTPWECTDFSPAPAPMGLMCDGDNGDADSRRRRRDGGGGSNDDDKPGECCKCPSRRRRDPSRRRRRDSRRRRRSSSRRRRRR